MVILDWHLSGWMETISAKEKSNKRKGCQNIAQKLCVHTVNVQTNKRTNAKTSNFFKCTHDIIQVEQKYAACLKK